MSFVLAAPESLVTAVSDLAGIGSALTTANAAAAPPTTGLAAAAGDEISTQVAALFSTHARAYQQLGSQASAFHQHFLQVLTASASSYATAESSAVQTLVNAVHAPAETLLGSLTGGGAAFSAAVGHLESAVLGGGAGLLGTGGPGLLASFAGRFGALMAPAVATTAAFAPAANAFAPIAQAIENAYNAIEPYVQYGFELLTWAAGWVIGPLASQIMFLYNLFEPMVQSGLFNILDWLGGSITFVQGLDNFFAATSASINLFIRTEINWVLGFFPPLPPLPPL